MSKDVILVENTFVIESQLLLLISQRISKNGGACVEEELVNMTYFAPQVAAVNGLDDEVLVLPYPM